MQLHCERTGNSRPFSPRIVTHHALHRDTARSSYTTELFHTDIRGWVRTNAFYTLQIRIHRRILVKLPSTRFFFCASSRGRR